MRSEATVVDLRQRRIARLKAELSPVLAAAGYVNVDASAIDSLDEWRAAARAVARRKGWKLRTGMSAGDARVWAVRL